MQGKILKLYFESHAAVKVAMVLVIVSICIPTDVCSKTISPLSFVGRTSGRINSQLMDKLMNLATKENARSEDIHDFFQNHPVVYYDAPNKPKRLPKRGSSDEELLSLLRGMDGNSDLMSMLSMDQKSGSNSGMFTRTF